MNDVKKMKETAERLSFMLLAKFKKELVEQGHVLDGSLRDSLEMAIDERIGGFTLSFMGLAYGLDLNDGRKAEDIPVRGSQRYVELLVDLSKYASKRFGVSGGLSFKIAKNIIGRWRVEGMPTRNSYRFSKNGRRKGWIDYVLENESEEIDKMVNEVMSIGIIDLIENNFLELNKI